MKEQSGKTVRVLRWILTVFLALFMVVGGVAVIPFALAALLVAPVDKLKNLKAKLKITPRLTVILTIVFFFAGCFLTPSTADDTALQNATNEAVTEKTKEESVVTEQEEVATEESAEEEPAEKTVVVEPIIPENSTFSIRYLDVGQADAALVECDGHYMLIDGGNKHDSDKMYAILKQDGIDHLDIIVGTHPDADHIGGLPGALNYATADLTLCSTDTYTTETFADFQKYADKNGGGIEIPEVGDKYNLGSSVVTILGVNGGNGTNESSIVLKIQYGETTFLFTGDAGREAEQAILNSGTDLSAMVLKVGHHGSADSTTYPFLREIMPLYAIISVGTDNSYQHPTDDVLSRLRDANVEVYRTDLQGDITVISDSKNVSISTEKTVSKEAIMMSAEATAIARAEAEAKEEAKAQAEAAASAKKKEESSSTSTSALAGTDYVLNTNTKKFHYPSCSSVKQMKAQNTTYYTGTRDEAISMGYDPCGNCHP